MKENEVKENLHTEKSTEKKDKEEKKEKEQVHVHYPKSHSILRIK